MGPGVLMYHYPGNDIMNGSVLTVESNHFCVFKSRGAILNVYETGQYPVESPQRPLIGSVQQAFYGGQSPWQYEALFIARAKSVAKAQGMALSSELAELDYDVDYGSTRRSTRSPKWSAATCRTSSPFTASR
jgi:membrane protease subunit (stomatin/prohibitin family)